MVKSQGSLLRPYRDYTYKQKKAWDISAWIAFGLLFVYMLWRAQYGFASLDESFYLTVPYRLSQGAAFFVDEWHGSQLTGFLLYPLMKLFLAFSPSGEGMVLAFRYFYAVTAALVCILIYFSTRKISPAAALAASLMLMIFAPYSIRALSYNSMGVLFVSAACMAAATAQEHKERKLALCGLLFAAAVLCCPYLIAVFLLYCICVPVAAMLSKKRFASLYDNVWALSPRAFLSFCTGAALLFVVFCVFFLSRSGIKEIIQSIPYILSDPEHGSVDLVYNLKRYIGAFYFHSAQAPLVIFGCAGLLAVISLDKGRIKRRGLYILISLMLTVVYSKASFEGGNVNFFMFPLCIPGIFAFILSREKQWPLFTQVFVPGLLYSLCMHFTSNQWYLAICLALSVSLMAAVFFLFQFVKEILEEDEKKLIRKRFAAGLLCVLMVGQIAVQLYYSVYHVDYEPSMWDLDTRVESGVQKGVITVAEKAEHYYAVIEDTQLIREQTEGYCLYFSDDVWLLLSDRKPTASFSGWLGFEAPDQSAQRVLEYWRLYPEKLPENIYIKDEFYYGYRESFYGENLVPLFEELGYETNKGETGWFLIKK